MPKIDDRADYCPACKAWYIDPRTVCYKMELIVGTVTRYCHNRVRFVDERGAVLDQEALVIK